MNYNYEMKALIMDTLLDNRSKSVDSDKVFNAIDMMNLFIKRYEGYENRLNNIMDFIEKDDRIEKIDFYYRTKYLGGTVFEVVFKVDEEECANFFKVFYKDGEIEYEPGVFDIIASEEEINYIKKTYFNDERYVEFFKEVGDFILEYFNKYEFNDINNDYKINVDIDKIILSLKKQKKYVEIIYLFDDKYIDNFYGETVFSIGNCMYKYRRNDSLKKLRYVDIELGRVYINTNVNNVNRILSNSLNNIIFSDNNVLGVNRLLSNIYIDRDVLQDVVVNDQPKVKKRVR